MLHRCRSKIICCTGLMVVMCQWTAAAELRLHSTCCRTGGVILLGDIAEVHSADVTLAAKLATLEIFPTPAQSERRYIDAREVRDLLVRRGVDIRDLTFSGASQVEISREEAAPKRAKAIVRRVNDSQRRRAKRLVDERLHAYLNRQTNEEHNWQLSFKLADDQVRLVLAHPQDVSIQGGQSPWTGLQRFVITPEAERGSEPVSLSVTVGLPASIVVAARSLRRAGVIRMADVRLEAATDRVDPAATLGLLEDVVGMQTTRSIALGQPITVDMIRPRVLVRRGNTVTVYVHSPGIEVRTIARAKQDGSRGELIELESLSDRATYFASVSGVDEVEIFARATKPSKRSSLPPQDAGSLAAEPARLAPQPVRSVPRERTIPMPFVSSVGVKR